MNRLEQYKKINNSFNTKLIFNLGAESGFYSEFNNMVSAILYCLKYGYKFVLFSDGASFKIDKGWEDYFKPFCGSTSFFFHKKLNRRTAKVAWKTRGRFALALYKSFNRDCLFTYELWGKFYSAQFDKEQFDIPELGIKGNLQDSSREIVRMIYRFNDSTAQEVNQLIAELNLPEKYASINVRRGDKDSETKFAPLSAYMEKLKQVCDLKQLFVLTDDYSVIEDIQTSYPEFTLYTLAKPTERGYIHTDFINETAAERKKKLIKLFASVEIVCSSKIAVGTYTTNPGLFFGMRMGENQFFSVQKASWYRFATDDIKEEIVQVV